jgi:hypothetical protein
VSHYSLDKDLLARPVSRSIGQRIPAHPSFFGHGLVSGGFELVNVLGSLGVEVKEYLVDRNSSFFLQHVWFSFGQWV